MKNKYEDEIELNEIFLWIKKKFVMVLIITCLSIILAIISNNQEKRIKSYEGKLYFEIGEILKEGNVPIFKIDLYYDIIYLINKIYNVDAFAYKNSLNIIGIKYINTDKEKIEQKLSEVLTFVIDRHKEKSKYFQNIIPTKQIGEIEISEINTDKSNIRILIFGLLGFLTSLIIAFLFDLLKIKEK